MVFALPSLFNSFHSYVTALDLKNSLHTCCQKKSSNIFLVFLLLLCWIQWSHAFNVVVFVVAQLSMVFIHIHKWINRQELLKNLRSGIVVLIEEVMGSSEERVVAVIMVGGPTKGIVSSSFVFNCSITAWFLSGNSQFWLYDCMQCNLMLIL